MEIFDRAAVRRHRGRAAARIGDHDFLAREIAGRLLERLGDIKREFALTLALGYPGVAPDGGLAMRADLSPLLATGTSNSTRS